MGKGVGGIVLERAIRSVVLNVVPITLLLDSTNEYIKLAANQPTGGLVHALNHRRLRDVSSLASRRAEMQAAPQTAGCVSQAIHGEVNKIGTAKVGPKVTLGWTNPRRRCCHL